MAAVTSAGGFIALLDEAPELKLYALDKLNALVSELWAEIAFSISKIEALAEDEKFSSRDLAALVASKVIISECPYDRIAGSQFDVFGKKDEYVETLVAKFVDEYIKLRTLQAEAKQESDKPKIDERLIKIIENMFNRCFKDGDFKPALGIALEARRTDKIQEAIRLSHDKASTLQYAYKVCMGQLTSRDFRQVVLRILVDLHSAQPSPDFVSIVQCLVFLDDYGKTADILNALLSGDQLGFDLCENATQQFRKNVREALPPGDPKGDEGYQLKSILTGDVSVGMALEFLFRNNHTDMTLLKNIKVFFTGHSSHEVQTAVENRNSVCHQATIFTNALMHSGTTRDTFLRENLEWLSRAANWAKFSATAGLGVIHKGHLKEGLSLLSPYLPQAGGGASSPYSEGGALYALGIIHANHGEEITKYLLTALHAATEQASNEILQHGACLGLGVAAMATCNEEVYDQLKNIMYADSAVAGEAAGLAMGLVMLGSASSKAIDEMLTYAHDTQHEKIIRGLAIGMALLMYGREEQADTLIEQLVLDKDPILRYGAMYTIALAYAGTGSNAALRRLLHVAVSDVSDDVRRAAVIAIGFLLFRQPKECPRIVSLLAASYNPHVRYGAALAVGISCAGTASKEALDLLEPLSGDAVDFVRQGALLATAMVLIQATKAQEPKVETFRKMLDEKISDKHEETLAKFGAIIAYGILDAGGRNVTINLMTRSGHSNLMAIVGLAIFTQFWYWFPLLHFVSLAFTPTAIIGLNKDLKMPKFSFKSNARPSLFAYPPDVKPPQKDAPTKVAPAVLSTAAKVKARKKDDGSPTPMEGVSPSTSTVDPGNTGETKKEDSKEEREKKEKEEKERKDREEKHELTSEILQNPARVTPAQLRFISFDQDSRYIPIKRSDAFGTVVLKDTKPELPEEFVGVAPASNPPAAAAAPAAPATPKPEEKEPEPPAPFEFE